MTSTITPGLSPVAPSVYVPGNHAGRIAGDEIPTILQRGEGVSTAGQMEALGFQHGALASLSSALGAASAERMAPPADIAGSSDGSTGTGNAAPTLLVNVHNQTGTPQTATASQPRFDGEKMIADIITKHVTQPVALSTAIKSRAVGSLPARTARPSAFPSPSGSLPGAP